jgi:hypothetical protein
VTTGSDLIIAAKKIAMEVYAEYTNYIDVPGKLPVDRHSSH